MLGGITRAKQPSNINQKEKLTPPSGAHVKNLTVSKFNMLL